MHTQDDLPPTPSTTRPTTPDGFPISRVQTGTSAYFSTYESPTDMASIQQLPATHAQDHSAAIPSPKYEEKPSILDETTTVYPSDVMAPPPTDVTKSNTPTPVLRRSIEKPPAADKTPVNGTTGPPTNKTSPSPSSATSSIKNFAVYPVNVDENKPIATQPDSNLSRHATGAFAVGAATIVGTHSNVLSYSFY